MNGGQKKAGDPNAWPDALGLDILVDPKGLTEQRLMALINQLASELAVADIGIYTSRTGYEEIQNVKAGEKIGPEGKAGFILIHRKNTTQIGRGTGAHEVRWMREVGPVADKCGTVTEL